MPHWLPPRDTTQLLVPTNSPAPYSPATAQGPAMHVGHQGLLFPLLTSKHLLLHLFVSLVQGELVRLFLNLYSASCFFLNQDSWAKNRKLCSSSAFLREALVLSGLWFRRVQVYQLCCTCLGAASSITCVPLFVKHNRVCFQRESFVFLESKNICM